MNQRSHITIRGHNQSGCREDIQGIIEHQSEVDRRRALSRCSNSGGLDAVQHAGSDDHLEQNRNDLRRVTRRAKGPAKGAHARKDDARVGAIPNPGCGAEAGRDRREKAFVLIVRRVSV